MGNELLTNELDIVSQINNKKIGLQKISVYCEGELISKLVIMVHFA